jgi:hypothetical protein
MKGSRSRTSPSTGATHLTANIAVTAGLLLVGTWSFLALWFELESMPLARGGAIAACMTLFVAAALAAWRRRWSGALPFGIFFFCLLGWWLTLTPSHDRDWALDVDRLLSAEIHGSKVKLHNVRNFDWRGENDFTARWETREFDLDQLETADLLLSYWMGPTIAHTLVSFGFRDGSHVVFSLEIRKEKGESFSALGGFFRRFETVIVAADERDIVRVRSNIRGEDVRLYRLQVQPIHLRALFLGYLERANALLPEPRFYNTLTSNCTTIVIDLARRINPDLPLDYRLLLSGYLADYAFDQDVLAPGFSLDTLSQRGDITARAHAAGSAGNFSSAIREGVPGIDPVSGKAAFSGASAQ